MSNAFGPESTADEVLQDLDLTGKRVLITGISAGLGLETARVLAARGAIVIGTARDPIKAQRALEPLRDLAIDYRECDLASLASVRACTDQLTARNERLDVVIANAGVMNSPFGHTKDGFETQFGTNHLGHFVLVNRVVPLIADGGRIVILSSSAHRAADVDLDDAGFQQTPYDPFTAYGRSKTANILFAVELTRRLQHRNIRATALHPGGVMTELMRHTTPDMIEHMAKRAGRHPSGANKTHVKTVEQGISTTVWAAFVANADEVGGRFCEDCAVADVQESGVGVRPYAVDLERAAALWLKSEAMVQETFQES